MNVSMNHPLKMGQYAPCQNSNQNKVQGKGSSLYAKVANTVATKPHRTVGQGRRSTYDAYCSMSARVGNQISFSNLGVQASGNPGTVENDKYAVSVYTEEGVKGHWRIYNKETGTTMSFDPKLTSAQINPETGKKYLTETDWYGGFMGAWGMDSPLEEVLRKFMGVDELQYSDVNDNFTLDKDATTGIVSIKRKGAEGNGASMIIEDEKQGKKLEKLANLYLEKYPSLVTSKEMALCFAKGEIMGYNVRDDSGVLAIGIGGMVYYNAQDPAKGWGISYSGYDSTIYSKIKEALVSGSITGNLISNYEKWATWLKEKEIDFELTTVEEDLERLREKNYSEWLRITSSLHGNYDRESSKAEY